MYLYDLQAGRGRRLMPWRLRRLGRGAGLLGLWSSTSSSIASSWAQWRTQAADRAGTRATLTARPSAGPPLGCVWAASASRRPFHSLAAPPPPAGRRPTAALDIIASVPATSMPSSHGYVPCTARLRLLSYMSLYYRRSLASAVVDAVSRLPLVMVGLLAVQAGHRQEAHGLRRLSGLRRVGRGGWQMLLRHRGM